MDHRSDTTRRAYKILLWKAYFDKGFSLLNYVKYIIAIAGVGAVFQGMSFWWVFVAGVVYGLICLILGRLWFKFKLIDTENEIQNIFNPFQREMREHISNRKL